MRRKVNRHILRPCPAPPLGQQYADERAFPLPPPGAHRDAGRGARETVEKYLGGTPGEYPARADAVTA